MRPIPKVSVVIANYNYARFLPSCLESIISQNYPNFEIILVDDGSTDDSVSVAKNYSNKVIIIQQENLGVNSARNVGIAAATGEYLAFCDSDDVWIKDKLKVQMDIFLEHRDAILVSCAVQRFKDSDHVLDTQIPEYSGDISRLFVRFPMRALVLNGPSTAILKRDLAMKIGMFNPNLISNGEDWDFFRRYCQLGNFYFSTLPLVKVRVHGESRSKDSLQNHYRGNVQAIRLALADCFYRWTLMSKFVLICRFEIQFIKSALKIRNFRQFFISSKNILIWFKFVLQRQL